MTIKHILYKSIRPDPKWKYRLNQENSILTKSLNLAGVLSPLVLLQDQNDFVILDGFKRYRFLEDNASIKVPSFLYSIQQAKEGVLHGLVLNEARQQLSVIEKSNVMKIVQLFPDDEELQNKVCSFLDIPLQRQFIEKYLTINALPDDAKQYLHEFQFSLRQIERIMPVSIQSLLPWIRLARELNIKAQEFVQLVEIIQDLSIKGSTSVEKLYEQIGINELMKQDLTLQRKVSNLKNFLHQKRYPMLHQIQKRVSEQVDRIQENSKLPVEITWDKKLEQSGYWVNIYLDNETSLKSLKGLFESSELDNSLRQLFEIIINRLENSDETS
jgi:hypothetical protein